MPSGGPRTPSNPAPVSGPGALSRRTDGQPAMPMTGGPYGEAQEMSELQTSAPMAQAQGTPNASPSALPPGGPSMPPPTGLFAPSERPDEPLTEGSSFGAGAGANVLSGGLGSPVDANNRDAQQLKQYLPALERTANMPGAPTSFVRFVSYLRSL